jgi:arylsulfatase A-like enzyme
MVYLFDVLPTLGKLCGVASPPESNGVEFTATLKDPSHAARPNLVFAYKGVQRAVRDDRWKVIRYPQVDKTQLFDLKADPEEATDLAAKPEHTAKLKEMLGLLETELKAAGDKAPLTVEKPQPAEWTPPKNKKE